MIEKKKFITFGKPDITEIEIRRVCDVLRSGWLSTGDVANGFARRFEEHLGNGAIAVPVSSCTMGLTLSLIASGITCKDSVIIPAMTFCATANAVLSIGANPIFVDVLTSGQMNPEKIKHAITKTTKAIIPVHYTGLACDMDEIMKISRDEGLMVIEDCAHAFGGSYKGKPLGTIGDFAAFSFYATKNITCGEGGMVVTKNSEFAERVRILSMNGVNNNAWGRYGDGKVKNYSVQYVGQKGNLSDIHAAIGLAQLNRWPEIKKKRDVIWEIYEGRFGYKSKEHSRHLYTIEVECRDDLREYLQMQGIGTGIHFKPLHLEPAYRFLDYKVGDFPMAEEIGKRTVSFPISSDMTEEDAKNVIEQVERFLNK